MKKLFAVISAALLLLSSCGKGNQKISDDEIKRLVDLDIQLGKYQMVECPSFDYYSPIEHNGKEYYPIIDERFDDWSEWEAYVKSVYTDRLAGEYLNNENSSIIEINGKSYCTGGSGGYDLTDEYICEIIKNENGRAEVLVKNPSVWNDEDLESGLIDEPVYHETTYDFVYVDDTWKIYGYIYD